MKSDPLKRILKNQIREREEELKKLKDCEEYIYNNFEATKSECDAVLGVISQVIEQKEKQIDELQKKLLSLKEK